MIRYETADLDSEIPTLIQLGQMQLGGYPFEQDDLSRDHWLALGAIKEQAEEDRWQKLLKLISLSTT